MRASFKKDVTIRIDANLVTKAKEIGLNILKVVENALIEMIKRIETLIRKSNVITYLTFKNGGPGRDRTGDRRHVKGLEAPFYAKNSHSHVKIEKSRLLDFVEYLELNMRLAPRTIRDTLQDVSRFLERSNWIVNYETISDYLKLYLGKAAWAYNSQIVSLRRFINVYLGRPELIEQFKTAPVNDVGYNDNLPTKSQVRAGFRSQICALDRAFYLFVATTELRKGEILGLNRDSINLETRAVRPNHHTRTKRSGITFYNDETWKWLKRYLSKRADSDSRLSPLSDRQYRNVWRRATDTSGVNIKAQILRVWFSSEMGGHPEP